MLTDFGVCPWLEPCKFLLCFRMNWGYDLLWGTLMQMVDDREHERLLDV